MLIKQSGKAVIKRSLKIGAALLIVTVIYYLVAGWLPRTEMLMPFHEIRDGIALTIIILTLAPSILLGLGVSDSIFIPNPSTTLGWFLGWTLSLLVFFILGFILSILIEAIKNAHR